MSEAGLRVGVRITEYVVGISAGVVAVAGPDVRVVAGTGAGTIGEDGGRMVVAGDGDAVVTVCGRDGDPGANTTRV